MISPNITYFKMHGFSRYICCLLICSLQYGIVSFGQAGAGKLTGKIIDIATNQTLSGVSITAKDTKLGVSSITDGSYILSLPAGTYTIIYSSTGYAPKGLSGIIIKAGQTTFQDVILEPDTKEIKGVIVTANANKEGQSALYSSQLRSAAASDGIGQDAIRKTTATNIGQVLTKVTGVNVQDNRFVVVRGLGDRYNQTMLNGAAMTSTETNRNAFAFDLIPAPVVESVTINKTATPDMPGNFAGGIVQINTKDFPDNNFFSVSLQGGFSDKTIGKDFYSDKRNEWEWLGFGGSIRDLPKDFPNTTSRVPYSALNLQEQTRYLRMLRNNLAPINQGPSKPNENVQLGYGRTIKFNNGTQFGIVMAINHRKTELIENEVIARDPNLTFTGTSTPGKLLGLGYYSENRRYRYSVDLGGVLNLAYRFGNSKITLKTLYSQVFKNTYTSRPDIVFDGYDLNNYRLFGISHFIEQRAIRNHILGGEHRTGANNETRLDWNVNITDIHTRTPDTRNFLLETDSLGKQVSVNTNAASIQQGLVGYSRVWSDNSDFIYGGAFNITSPFNLFKNKQLLKGGILFQNRRRKATGTILPISGLKSNSVDSLLDPSNFYPGGAGVNIISSAIVDGSGNYNAASSLLAAYESLENRVGKKWRIIWGLRVENYQQNVNVYRSVFYDNFKDPELQSIIFAASSTFNFLPSVNIIFSPYRTLNFRAAYSNTVIRPELKDIAEYERYDLQTFTLSKGTRDLKSTSIRNYDLKIEWVPSNGEIISFAAFYKNLEDPIEYALDVTNRYGIRQALNTGSAYVKGVEMEIRKKINFISFAPWLRNVTFFGNGSLIRSKVSGKNINSITLNSFSEHSLSGQPDYIINGGMSILAFKESFETTFSFNRTGDFINELGSSDLDVPLPNGMVIPRNPHYREKARNMLDVVISQSILRKKGKLRINVSNILNERFVIYQDLNGNGKFDKPVTIKRIIDRNNNYQGGIDNTASSINPQRTYSFTFSYTF